ncbi:MAG: D-allose transporter substrate-binding protein [Saccharofermentanales bacterium]|jgi:D-allose transport system substrate-binding protein
MKKSLLTKIVALLLLSIMVLGIAACGGSGKTEEKAEEKTEEKAEKKAEEKAEEKTEEKVEEKTEEKVEEKTEEKVEEAVDNTEVSADDSEISLYFLLKTLANPHWVTMKEGIEEAAKSAGIEVYVDAVNSEDELGPQLDKMISSVSGDYDGIAVAPISSTNCIEGVVAANKKGIPVFDIDERIDEEELEAAGGYIVGFAATDNAVVGEKGAKFIVEQIGEGKVAIIEGKAGSPNGEARVVGSSAVFNETEGIELVDSQPADWDRNKALDVATNIIQQHPDIKAFYCANDTMALGVQEAVENANLQDDCIVVGTDGTDDALDSIKEGRLAATVAQDPAAIGARSFELLLDAVKKGEDGSGDYEPILEFVDSILVTQDD